MPVCEGCNASFDESFAFCPYCGRAKPEIPKVKLEIDLPRKQTPDDCPICGNNMNTQKVSAIVASGTNRGIARSSTSGNIDIRRQEGKQIAEGRTFSQTSSFALNQNDLAKYLNAPEKPQEEKESLGCGVLMFFGSLFMVFIAIITDGPAICVGLFILSSVFGLLFLITLPSRIDSNEKRYQEKLRSYEKAMYVWEHLYYCHKHDIVFLEGQKDHFPAKKTLEACYTLGNSL